MGLFVPSPEIEDEAKQHVFESFVFRSRHLSLFFK
jgi:hypothetical protein